MKVVVGLSGGVDSSVAAYLLKQEGYDVVALFMKNWHDTTGLLKADCPFDEDVDFASMVARKLQVPFHTVDLSVPYRQRVVNYMFSEYERGRTPNPDVLCNREIKFDEFFDAALELGADYVATGHYCRKEVIEVNGQSVFRLLAGADGGKDQSYFLCQLSQQQLSKALFPIGHLVKNQVRSIASELGLATAQRKDSQGICFVGKVDLPVFLQQKLAAKDGNIVEIPYSFYSKQPSGNPCMYKPTDGKVVGKHQGAHFFTIGQRKGLNVGGSPEPLYVIETDVISNTVYVGQGQEHPGLYRSTLFIPSPDIHWVRPDMALTPGSSRAMNTRIRYRQPLQDSILTLSPEGLVINFSKPQRGITPGQFAAWYSGDELVGSGVIA